MYAVKEIFYTLQGEGFQAGRAAVFCRFSGCNLWSGREADRSKAACSFCDTDFVGTGGVGGGKYRTTESLADRILLEWNPGGASKNKLVVFTGGEPLLQLDESLIEAVRERGFQCAVETNGTLPEPRGVDWLTVSPKGSTAIRLHAANEIKLVYPQPLAPPERFESFDASHYFLQPMDGPDLMHNTRVATEYCLAHPKWRLGVQLHKMIGIP